jgi:hypothetical protein
MGYKFPISEYCKYHYNNKAEYAEFLEKKAKQANLIVEHIP